MHEVCLIISVLVENWELILLCSVSEELLCAFELLKPLDGPALRKEMTKAKRKRYVATPLKCHTTTNACFSMMATT